MVCWTGSSLGRLVRKSSNNPTSTLSWVSADNIGSKLGQPYRTFLDRILPYNSTKNSKACSCIGFKTSSFTCPWRLEITLISILQGLMLSMLARLLEALKTQWMKTGFKFQSVIMADLLPLLSVGPILRGPEARRKPKMPLNQLLANVKG